MILRQRFSTYFATFAWLLFSACQVAIAAAPPLDLTPQERAWLKANPEIVLGVGFNSAPAVQIDKNGDMVGIEPDILSRISAMTGAEFRLKQGIWAEMVKQAENAELQGLALTFKHPERAANFLFTISHLTISRYAYARTGAPFGAMEDFAGRKVGYLDGALLNEKLLAGWPDIQPVPYPSLQALAVALFNGDVDGAVGAINLLIVIRQDVLSDIGIAFSIPGTEAELRYSINRRYPELLSIMNKALTAIGQREINAIRDKWGALPDPLMPKLLLSTEEEAWLAQHPRIVLGISEQFQPDVFVHADGSRSGLVVDYFRLLNQQLDNRLALHVESAWSAVTAKAMRGEIDGLASSAPNPTWDKHFLYTEPFYHGYFHLYTRAGTPPAKRLPDLAGKQVGYLAGMKRVEYLTREVEGIKLRGFASNEQMAKALLEGQVDILIGAIDLEWWRKHNSIMGFEISGFIESSRHPVLMSVRQDWPLLPGIINKALHNIPASKRERINQTWLGSNATLANEFHLTPQERVYLDTTLFRRAASQGWRPFSFLDAEGRVTGISEDYWALLRDKLGLREQRREPDVFTAVIDAMQRGEVDILPSTTDAGNRSDYALFSDAYENFPIAIAMRRDNGFITDAATLQEQVVAVGRDYSAYHLLKAKYPGIAFLPVGNTAAALDAVAENRAFAAVDILPVLQHDIAARNDNAIHLSGVTDVAFPLKIMLRKEHARLLPLLNRAIAAITPAERLEIHKKWMWRDVVTESRIDYTLLWQVSGVALVVILIVLYWNQQLARQIARRQRAEQQLQETGERLRSILASMDDLVFVLDTEHRIVDVYYRDPHRLMMPPDEFLGKTCREVLPPEIYAPLERAIQDSRDDSARQFEYRVPLKEAERWSQASVSARYDGCGNFVGSTVVSRDITEQKQAQQRLQRSLNYQSAVAKVSLCLLDQGGYQDNISQALHYLRDCSGTARVYIFENFSDADNQCCTRYAYEACGPGVASELDNPLLQHFVYNDGLQRWTECLQRGESLHGQVAHFPQSEREVLEPQGIQSILVVPIQVQGEWWGLIGFDETRYAREWFEEEMTMLKMAATSIGRYLTLIRLQEELESAKNVAETANQAKSVFLANMSHELRTPLNAVLGYAQVLQREPALGEKPREHVNIIKRSGDYLLTLINDVLDLAKIEAGKLELIPTECQLDSFFTELAHLFRLRATEKKIAFVFQAENLPAYVKIDAKRLRQICLNLLGNAMKFTEQGEVRLNVTYQSSAGKLIIQVSDTGCGIPAKKQGDIFQPFSQTGTEHYKQQGTGLGLAISRSLLERMGGRIDLDSEEGRGSCFTLHVPVCELKTAPSAAKVDNSSHIEGYRRGDGRTDAFSLLVVDDEPFNRRLVFSMLKPLGFNISEATDGKEALAMTENQHFDLIFMDMVMQDIDGLSATCAILKRPGNANQRIVAFTARAFEEDRAKCLAAGCCDYLSKPISRKMLLHVIQTHLPLTWQTKTIIAPAEATQTAHNTSLSAQQREDLQAMLKRGAIKDIVKYLNTLLKTSDCPGEAQTLLNLAKRFKLPELREQLAAPSE
jgi:PAS domain S-box-containing protein